MFCLQIGQTFFNFYAHYIQAQIYPQGINTQLIL